MPDRTEDSPPERPRWRGRRRVLVHDRSMEPFLSEGDRLYVDTRAYKTRRPARGDVVVFRDPESSGRLLIKRVAGVAGDVPAGAVTAVPPDHLYVVGDRRSESRDSRSFGPVAQTLVLGRVRFRYAPADRRGPLDDRSFK